jgi:hypothetical protein
MPFAIARNKKRGQQLSSLSSPLSYWCPPWGPILQHGVEHGQQLPHARGEHDLLGFPGRAQALGERANDGIEARRHECAHREDRADLCAPAPDRALPTQRPAVTIQGCLSTSCRRRARIAASVWVCSSGRDRGSGRRTSAKCAKVWASTASVLASFPPPSQNPARVGD